MKSIREALTKSTEPVQESVVAPVVNEKPIEKPIEKPVEIKEEKELRIQISQGLPKPKPKVEERPKAQLPVTNNVISTEKNETKNSKLDKFVNTIKSMLSDTEDDNAISSKRVVAFLAFIFCSIAFFANLFFGFVIDEFLYQSMIWIVVGGLGFTTIEKFVPKK